MNLDEISQYIPGSHNYGHYMKPIAPLLLAGVSFAASGGLEGIIGSGKRKKEEGDAKREQAENLAAYKNFDYNQDVGAINDPYRENILKTERYNQQQIDQNSANQLDLQKRSGNFGAAQGILGSQNQASLVAGQQVNKLRQQGANFVEQQRQSRIRDKFDTTQTLLARSDERLASAKRARTKATQNIVKGIGAGVSSGIGAAAASQGLTGAAKWKAAVGGSGLLPNSLLGGGKAAGPGAGAQFQKFQDVDFGKIGD